MHDWMDWPNFICGLIGAIGVLQVWFGFMRPNTTNIIGNGDHNDQAGGKGTTVNSIKNGNNNKQRG